MDILAEELELTASKVFEKLPNFKIYYYKIYIYIYFRI